MAKTVFKVISLNCKHISLTLAYVNISCTAVAHLTSQQLIKVSTTVIRRIEIGKWKMEYDKYEYECEGESKLQENYLGGVWVM